MSRADNLQWKTVSEMKANKRERVAIQKQKIKCYFRRAVSNMWQGQQHKQWTIYHKIKPKKKLPQKTKTKLQQHQQ